MRKMLSAGALALTLILSGCGAAGDENVTEEPAPNQTSIEIADENVYDFELSDGTRCVLADGPSSVALTCDWNNDLTQP